jgi:hypothetical protein
MTETTCARKSQCTGIQEDEESLMARFLVGLNESIVNKVDMTNYNNITELVHFAKRAERHTAECSKNHVTFSARNSSTQWCHIEQQGLRSHTSSSCPSLTSSRPVVTLGKSIQVKDKGIDMNRSTSSSDKTRQKTSNIECFKCGGHGHKKAECPNHRVIIAVADGAYDSQSDDEDAHDDTNSHDRHFESFEYEAEDGEHELGLNYLVWQQINYFDSMEEITYDDFEELLVKTDSELCSIRSGTNHLSSNSSAHDRSLVVHRVLSTQLVAVEQRQRHNLFQSMCKVKGQVCCFIIDGGSCNSVVSATLVDKLGLQTHCHPHPYHMQWLNNSGIVKVTSMVRLPFSIGDYHDEVDCDIVPMQACHLLLGHPWQFDVDATHFGRSNKHSFIHKEKKVVLVPLSSKDIHASDVARRKREDSEKRKMGEAQINGEREPYTLPLQKSH